MPYTKKPRAPRRKHARKPKSKMTFEKRVMNVVHKQAETKQKVINLYDNQNLQGSGLDPSIGSGLQVINLASALNIIQGNEQEQRNGNEISNVKLRCRGLVESLPYDGTTNPSIYNYEVHMVVFKKKDDPLNSINNLKTGPNNATLKCDGTLINTMYPYNKDAYIIKKVKTFRMLPHLPGSANAVVPIAQPNTYTFKRFYVDIPVSKKWKYGDALSAPSNEWTSIGFYVVNADGTSQAGTSVSRCQLTMDAMITYDDF